MNQEFQIPKTFKAAQLTSIGSELVVTELEMPQLNEGDVLIRVEAAPVNPSDVLLHQGEYPTNKVLPAVTGIEGAGVIVKIHDSVKNVSVGDRVAFTTLGQYGTYGQYSVTNSYAVIKLDDDISFEIGASSIVNPVTVMAMLEEVKLKKVQAVVHTAAASALGRMFVKYFQNNGIKVINVVRRKEQEDILKGDGAEIILNQTSETFLKDLNKLANELGATIAFDAIGGSLTGQILEQLPNNSTIYVYGFLSGSDVNNVKISDLLFKGKNVSGFWLATFLQKYNPFSDPQIQKQLNQLLKSTLKTQYGNEYTLDSINEGIKLYKENQTARKILIKPNKQN